jgi:hypothetical protein
MAQPNKAMKLPVAFGARSLSPRRYADNKVCFRFEHALHDHAPRRALEHD